MAWFGCLAMSRPRRCAIMQDDCKLIAESDVTYDAESSYSHGEARVASQPPHGDDAEVCSDSSARILQSRSCDRGTPIAGQAADPPRRTDAPGWAGGQIGRAHV